MSSTGCEGDKRGGNQSGIDGEKQCRKQKQQFSSTNRVLRERRFVTWGLSNFGRSKHFVAELIRGRRHAAGIATFVIPTRSRLTAGRLVPFGDAQNTDNVEGRKPVSHSFAARFSCWAMFLVTYVRVFFSVASARPCQTLALELLACNHFTCDLHGRRTSTYAQTTPLWVEMAKRQPTLLPRTGLLPSPFFRLSSCPPHQADASRAEYVQAAPCGTFVLGSHYLDSPDPSPRVSQWHLLEASRPFASLVPAALRYQDMSKANV